MATRFWKKKIILFKLETVYGTDATPTGTTDAVLASNIKLTPLKTEMVTRDIEQATMGNSPNLAVASYRTISFDVELAGSGTAGTAPKFGKLLRCAGFSEVITAGTSVVYAPVSEAFESATLYINIDGKLYKMWGVRGTVGFNLSAKGIPKLTFEMSGLCGPVTDTAMATVDLTGFQKPVPVNNVNTTGFAVNSFSTRLYELQVSVAAQTVYRNLPGAEDFLVTNRQPSGSLVIEDPSVADWDYIPLVKTAAAVPVTLTHGTVAGNKVKIDLRTELGEPDPDQRDGVVVVKFPLRPVPSAGNDEIVFTFL